MPPIQSVTIIPDGVTLVTTKHGTVTLTRAQIPPATLLQPVAQIEAFVNAFLDSHIDSMLVRVHIFQVNPVLLWTYGTWNLGLTPEPNWWVTV